MASDVFKALTVSYKSGERIVAAGEQGRCMFIVNSGSVKLLKAAAQGGTRAHLGLLEKGDFFGESSILDGKPYGVDAEAESDCDVVEIGASVFHHMLQSNPEIAVRMMRKMSARLDGLRSRVAQEPAEAQPAATTEQAEPGPEKPALETGTKLTGRLVTEGGGGVFPLRGQEILVGRYDPVTEIQPEIDLSAVDTKRSVSRRHSRLTYGEGKWRVEEEVGALNGTFVNGTRLVPGQRMELSDGDQVSFGMVRVVFREA